MEELTVSGDVAIKDTPLFGKKKKKVKEQKYKMFEVPAEVFRKFDTGRNKFERWSKYLDLADENQKSIYDYATRNTQSVVVLRDSTTGAMRAIRRRSANGL